MLMYHRILPKTMVDEAIEPGMYVTSESFIQHLAYLAKHFDVLPLATLLSGAAQCPHENSKPRCAITFDDGWLDFLLYAFPVLQQFKAPATVFLPTNFIGTDRRFWTDTVAELLLPEHQALQSATVQDEAGTLRTNIVFQHLSQANATSVEGRIDQVINGLKRHRAEDIYLAVDELKRGGYLNETSPRSFLNWEEVQSLKESGLVTFGSHTADHNILTTIQLDEVRRELSQSKIRLMEENAVPLEEPLFFCYPNGNSNQQLALMVEEAGYAGAVTTKKGWNAWGQNRFLLNRVGLHEDMSSTQAMFACRLAGFI